MTFFGVDVRNGVPVGLGSIAAFGRRGFTPASLFAQGEAGVWYDPSDLGTMFTTSDGTTPVTGVEQAVGLILDKSRGLVQSQFSTNDNFASGATGWSAQSGWSVGTGSASVNSSAGTTLLRTSATSVAGRAYIISFVVSSYTSGLFRAVAGTAFAGTASAIGTYTFIVFSNGGAGAGIWADSTNTVGTITSLSVREIAGNHAIQPGATNRPVLRNRYNLLTYSEQFDNAAWQKNNCSVTSNGAVAPDGATTADQIIEDSATSQHFVQQAYTFVAAPHTFSLYIAKSSTRNALVFMYTASGIAGVLVDVAAGTGSVFSGSIAGTTVSVVNAGSYWLASVTATMPAAAGSANIYLVNGTSTSYAGNGTSSITIWGADIRRSIDTIYPYQRIAAATVYDSDASKFPLYLAFDGSDDSLYTGGSIDFSATDKMTVWAGVTKLSDAATGVTLEFSADAGTNNGAWAVYAPGAAAAPRFDATSRGTTARGAGVNSAPYAAPITTALTAIGDISGDLTEMRLNGVSVNSNTGDQGTGNYGSYPLYIGRRNNASLPFNGRLHQLIVRGAASSAAEISSAERWVAGKQGRAL